jgi:hypothetical protein
MTIKKFEIKQGTVMYEIVHTKYLIASGYYVKDLVWILFIGKLLYLPPLFLTSDNNCFHVLIFVRFVMSTSVVNL